MSSFDIDAEHIDQYELMSATVCIAGLKAHKSSQYQYCR